MAFTFYKQLDPMDRGPTYLRMLTKQIGKRFYFFFLKESSVCQNERQNLKDHISANLLLRIGTSILFIVATVLIIFFALSSYQHQSSKTGVGKAEGPPIELISKVKTRIGSMLTLAKTYFTEQDPIIYLKKATKNGDGCHEKIQHESSLNTSKSIHIELYFKVPG